MSVSVRPREIVDTARLKDLRGRVRRAMEEPPEGWPCPERIAESYMEEPLPVRKARAIALKLSEMPVELWEGQLFAGSMTLEEPRLHAEWGFPAYTIERERAEAAERGVGVRSVFGHIVPDYPRLLNRGLRAIRTDAERELEGAEADDEQAFLRSVIVAVDGVLDYARRLREHCRSRAEACNDPERAAELTRMAENLEQVPAGPARTFWQALQSVWLLHMIFHSTLNGNAMGRVDRYVGPFLEADLRAGRIDMESAAELCGLWCLKFNERAKATEEQRPGQREDEPLDFDRRTRHYTSSQLGRRRDRLDATNHWLQNIVIGGLTPEGEDGTNRLTHLLLEAYRRNEMTNPLLTVRVHENSPDELLRHVAEVLKDGGGMPALFNDETIPGALQRIGIPTRDALDYTNDGCWEVIIPGRTDFRFQRLSLMLCLEWALNRGRSRRDQSMQGVDVGDPREFESFDDLWQAFLRQVDAMVGRTIEHFVQTVDDRSTIAPVPLLSALIEGPLESHRDMTAGGARFRTFAPLAESAAYAIDSLTAIKTVVFEGNQATMAELCDALEADFQGYPDLRAKLRAAPKYGNDDERADAVGRDVIRAFVQTVSRHTEPHRDVAKFPCGVGTFSWYIGIGEGLGASPDGRRCGEPVASNFSPSLGRDAEGLPGAILSYAKMHHDRLPAGGPLDLRMPLRHVEGEEGTDRMVGLIRAFVETGGAMMTLTVADTEELRAAQREPDKHESLRVRMGGWSAYFTMLSREQQDHHIRRQEGR
ncbi:MAG: pyruvate formate lyase family protein [Planctomycetota bacterium]